ncbi:hypothetical protein J7L06_07855 [Candidatus Bathyarchaeota archaeon]|nr:hypothetical protein [Candidatus Bathyarchaeota archaeon]
MSTEDVTEQSKDEAKEEAESLELKEELSELGSQVEEREEEERDLSTDIMELKRRMNRTEKEISAVTEALKSTLLDIRSFLTEMDNPFNLLRSMGVDKLVSKAMERVEEEVEKAKREEAKKRIAKKDDERPKNVIEVHATPTETTEVKRESVQAGEKQTVERSFPHLREVYGGIQSQQVIDKETYRRFLDQEATGKPIKFGSVKEQGKSELEETYEKPTLKLAKEDYYEIYVNTVAGLLFLRLGERGSREILSEYIRKGWASPKTILDILDSIRITSTYAQENGFNANYLDVNIDLEDKMLLTSVLKKLAKPFDQCREEIYIPLLLFVLKTLTWLLSKRDKKRKKG